MKHLFLFSILFSNFCFSQNNNSTSTFFTDSIFSVNLNEYRKHNIYLPKSFDKNQKYAIIYATDGHDINEENSMQQILDSLIENQIIHPIIYVESYSNNKIADSTSMVLGNGQKVYLKYRNFEYVRNYSSDKSLKKRFKNHMSYFKDELIPSIELKLHQNTTKDQRYFYGYSNGGGFGINLLFKHPEIIGTYLCFGSYGGKSKQKRWRSNITYPNLYFIYGNLEPPFVKEEADILIKKYNNSQSNIIVKEFNGGHDFYIWKKEFIQKLTELFPVENN